MGVNGQVVWITGAAQGIGRSYAERFVEEGAIVVITDLDAVRSDATVSELHARGHVIEAAPGDVTNESEMTQVASTILQRHGRIDCLINNAALYGGLNFRDQSVTYLEQVLRVNLIGPLIVSRAAFPSMKQRRHGSVINIASTAAYEFVTDDVKDQEYHTIPSFSYSLSKAALVSLTKFMAGAVGQYGIRVNCICPGMTLSDATRRLPQELIDAHAKDAAMGCILEPNDIAGTAVYLASEDSRLVTGQVIMVDAGYVMAG